MRGFFTVTTALVLCLCAWVGADAQSGPAFEVVSIKPIPPPTPATIQDGTSRPVFNIDASRVEISGFTPIVLLARAFQVSLDQIDAPDFARGQYFAVQATLPAGATREQVPEMLRTMLVERFKLVYHRETREYPVTVVTVGKTGIKLTRLPDDTPTPRETRVRLPDGTTRITMVGKVSSLFPVMNSFGGFPRSIDETGLDGRYTWVQDQAPASPERTFQEIVHDSFTAMMEAAGLRLEARKVPQETIVVDHLEKMPTEN